MNNNPQNDANQLKIELSPEVVEGVYSNLAVLTHSSAEFIFDFVRVLPGTNKAPREVARGDGAGARQTPALRLAEQYCKV